MFFGLKNFFNRKKFCINLLQRRYLKISTDLKVVKVFFNHIFWTSFPHFLLTQNKQKKAKQSSLKSDCKNSPLHNSPKQLAILFAD
jgi:hypothetical protein